MEAEGGALFFFKNQYRPASQVERGATSFPKASNKKTTKIRMGDLLEYSQKESKSGIERGIRFLT